MIWLRYALKWFIRKRFKNRRAIEAENVERAIFWCRDARDLPPIDALRDAVDEQLQGVLCFARWPSALEKERCIAHTKSVLPDCRVGAGRPDRGFDSIYFARVLKRAEILENAPELLESAREFGALATELAHELAAKIGVTPAQLTSCGQYLPAAQEMEQRGALNPHWNYFFHGFQCGFKHRESGQIVDVEFGFGEEFGVLDPMFWHNFLDTTPRYAHLAQWMALDYADARTMFDVLIETGDLVEIEGRIWDHTRRGFIAKPNS